MKTLKLLALAMAMVAIVFTACVKPQEQKVEDGVYLIGSATQWNAVDEAAVMFPTKNEKGNVDRPELLEKFVKLAVGEVKITKVEGGQEVSVGVSNPVTIDQTTWEALADNRDDNPFGQTYYDAIDGETTAISITEAGFYHIVYDKALNKVVVVKMLWGVRGAMNGWGFTEMTPNADFTSFVIDNVSVESSGQFKFAYLSAWKMGIDVLGKDATVKVNTNLGSTMPNDGDATTGACLAGGKNFGIGRGIWTITLTAGAEGTWSCSVALKEALPEIDPTTQIITVIGDFCNWGAGEVQLAYQETTGGISYYSGSVALTAGGKLKLRLNNDWGTNWGAGAVTPTGSAAAHFSGTDDFIVDADGTYTFRFGINWNTNAVSLQID